MKKDLAVTSNKSPIYASLEGKSAVVTGASRGAGVSAASGGHQALTKAYDSEGEIAMSDVFGRQPLR
ncbi:MAG TPA: hypothetical protein VF131_13335 [Blastocatellia bacterium]|nr:hypothetical protein [Blastocatellia bacterium]